MDGGVITVTQLNSYIKGMFDRDDILCSIAVCAEISNIKYHSSGHLYLTLKDDGASINAVVFRGDLMRMDFRPENGMRVIAYGRVSVYEKSGAYQLYISYMKPDGLGQLYMALEALKKRLFAEGIFDNAKKKKLPRFPKRIGVVTSPTGAVIRDILKVSGRRYPMCDIVLFPVHVQGELAVGEICSGISYFNIEKNVDVIIVGRGGGSMEDLWAFNSEAVVRSVAASDIPVISAVGHQTDTTLCDLAADVVAGTPSMAAELAVPQIENVTASLEASLVRMRSSAQKRLDDARMYLDDRTNLLELNSPKNTLLRMSAELDARLEKIKSLGEQKMLSSRLAVSRCAAKLEALSPLAVLARGYGHIQDEDGKTLTSSTQMSCGQNIRVTMSDGYALAKTYKVVTKNEKSEEK